MKKCEKCQRENNDNSYFCRGCGHLLGFGEIKNKDVYAMTEFKIARILANLRQNNVPHTKILWDDTVDLYTRKVEKCRAIVNVPEIGAGSNSDIVNKMMDFLDACKSAEFQIAFVGTIKTGKSTLINALLGSDYASVAVTPETAALTKFRSSPRDYVRVKFYLPEEWEKLWASRTSAADVFMQEYEDLHAEEHKSNWIGHNEEYKELPNDKIKEELKKWSSSQSAVHYFVKEIEVGISTLPKSIPEQVVFVDTPGLSDPVAYRSEITREYIRRANAVFVCIDAQKIEKEEIDTISSVFSFSSHNKSKVHIIATHYDKLNNPKEDWDRQKTYFLKLLVGSAFFDTKEQATSNIKKAAALIYNCCRDYAELEKDKKKSLLQFALALDIDLDSLRDNIPAMMRETGVEEISDVINNQLAGKYREYLLQDIKQKYDTILHDLRRIAEERKIDEKKLIDAGDSSVEELKKQLETHKKDYEQIKNSSDQLNAFIKAMQKETDVRLEYIVTNLKKLAKE